MQQAFKGPLFVEQILGTHRACASADSGSESQGMGYLQQVKANRTNEDLAFLLYDKLLQALLKCAEAVSSGRGIRADFRFERVARRKGKDFRRCELQPIKLNLKKLLDRACIVF